MDQPCLGLLPTTLTVTPLANLEACCSQTMDLHPGQACASVPPGRFFSEFPGLCRLPPNAKMDLLKNLNLKTISATRFQFGRRVAGALPWTTSPKRIRLGR